MKEGLAKGKEKGKAEGIVEARLAMIVDVVTSYKSNGPEACKEFAKRVAKATDAEADKAVEIVFSTTNK